ncbi:HBR110Wp [Eremothecium sinecaudum]|uniref:HBR110Wp n=1 Tax=Eremothecium sinecaudum TaxID=45286 RepID=A0A125RDZ7_9SACH|nr:HBR110Wp [Eremothecium sinecaudum]AMD19011.1 HBR110Wp [Eremothecium sinecaudum]
MSNPFDLLGNDVEDSTVTTAPPKEIIKKTTSSKKADVPPPSADPSKAKNNRPKPSGNDAAFKDKQAGRSQNKNKDAPVAGKGRENKPYDRHSRTGKTDSAKKIKQAWGDNEKQLADEEAGAAIAEAELAAEDVEEQQPAAISLEAYLNEQNAEKLNSTVIPQKVEKLEDAELFVKKEQVFVEPAKVKTHKPKQVKTKQYLEFDGTETFPAPNRGQSSRRGGRGGKKGGKRGSHNAPKQPIKADFPALV